MSQAKLLNLNRHGQKINSLQFIRGFSALLITLFHCEYELIKHLDINLATTFFQFGWIGVPLFFILTGFFIPYSSFYRERKAFHFLYGRLARIYPLYLVSFLVFLIPLIIMPIGSFGLNYFNWQQTWDTIFFGFGEAKGYIGISWTIFYQMCFYFVFSFLIFKFKRISSSKCFYLFIATFQIMLFILANKIGSTNLYLDHYIIYNISYFLIGISLFLIFLNPIEERYNSSIYIVLFSALGFSLFSNYFAIICFSIFFIVIKLEELYPSLFVNRSFLAIGDASYSIYITQLLPIAASLKISKYTIHLLDIDMNNQITLTIICLLTCILCMTMAICLGLACRKFIEKPAYQFLMTINPFIN